MWLLTYTVPSKSIFFANQTYTTVTHMSPYMFKQTHERFIILHSYRLTEEEISQHNDLFEDDFEDEWFEKDY